MKLKSLILASSIALSATSNASAHAAFGDFLSGNDGEIVFAPKLSWEGFSLFGKSKKDDKSEPSHGDRNTL